MPSAAAWNPAGTTGSRTSPAARLVSSTAGRSRRDEDVFPFRPQWLSPTSSCTPRTARSGDSASGCAHRATASRSDAARRTAAIVPFTAKVSLQRSTYTIAHRALEPAEPQTADRHRQPGRLAGRPRDRVHRDGRSLGAAGRRTRRCRSPTMRPSRSIRRGRPTARGSRSPAIAAGTWISGCTTSATTGRAQLTEERGAVSGPAWSPDGNHIAYLLDHRDADDRRPPARSRTTSRSPRPTPRRAGTADLVGRQQLDRGRRLFPYSNRYREGLNQTAAVLARAPAASSSSVLVRRSTPPATARTPGRSWSPDGFRMAFVSEGALWVVPVDERGGATGPPQAIADDQPESPSWEGDSKHIVYQTPRGLRRIIADGSLPDPIPLDLTWRNGADARAHRRPRRTRARRRARGGARRSPTSSSNRASSAASRSIATSCTPARSSTRRTST